MKKRIIVLSFITAFFLMVFSTNVIKMLHFHHNGTTTSIPLANVLSITHSMYDADKTAVVSTVDKEYSFLIDDIDSVTINEMMVTLEEVSPILEDHHLSIKGKIWGYDNNNANKYRCDLIINEGAYVISNLNANTLLHKRLSYLIKNKDGSIDFKLPLLDEYLLGFCFKLNTIYGFTLAVEYEGEWYYSQTRFCSWSLCPDDHHPHYIDLNLPSGTKWRCCNAGAYTPANYGDYYAFGETLPKTTFTLENYSHLVEHTIGPGSFDTSITWPDHDPSFMKSSNCTEGMPSIEQVRELGLYTETHTYVSNGVNGLLVQGSNGSLIFLPAGGQKGTIDYLELRGYFWAYQLSSVGVSPYYWTFGGAYKFEEGKSYSTSPNQSSDFYFGRNIRPVLTFYGNY